MSAVGAGVLSVPIVDVSGISWQPPASSVCRASVMSSAAPRSVTSPLSTIRSGCVARMRSSAAMPVLASVGLAAVNWMSEIAPKCQSSLPLVRPSGENSASGLSGSSPGAGTDAATSSSIDL